MASQEISLSNFGLVMAYVLPGFTALRGLPYLASVAVPTDLIICGSEATVAGFLYGTVEAVTAGLTVSAVRWLAIDTLHHHTGLRPPRWDFGLLEKNVAAFELLVQIHYRYYKFYANMAVAVIWAYGGGGYALGWGGLWYGFVAAVFLAGSRDSLRKYYERAGRLLSPRARNHIQT